ncbi:RnfH family protein [Magnetospira thiophila]
MSEKIIRVGVSYATPQRQLWLTVDLPEGSTVQQAIDASGICDEFPEIDLSTQKVGTFGKLAALDDPLEDETRVEIYRPITADPKTAKRKKTAPSDPEE